MLYIKILKKIFFNMKENRRNQPKSLIEQYVENIEKCPCCGHTLPKNL